MTQLPKWFTAIACWLSLQFLAFVMPLARSFSGYTGPQETAPAYVKATWLGVLGLVILLIFWLFQLRPIGIWVSISLAVIFAATALLRLPALIAAGNARPSVIAGLVLVPLNVVSAWYLSRPALLALLERRRVEREHESIRRFAEKQVRKAAGP